MLQKAKIAPEEIDDARTSNSTTNQIQEDNMTGEQVLSEEQLIVEPTKTNRTLMKILIAFGIFFTITGLVLVIGQVVSQQIYKTNRTSPSSIFD